MFGYVQIRNLYIVEIGKNRFYFDHESYDTKYYFDNTSKFTFAKKVPNTHFYECIFTKSKIKDYHYQNNDDYCCCCVSSSIELLSLFCDEKYIKYGFIKKRRLFEFIRKLNEYKDEDNKVMTYSDNVIPFRRK